MPDHRCPMPDPPVSAALDQRKGFTAKQSCARSPITDHRSPLTVHRFLLCILCSVFCVLSCTDLPGDPAPVDDKLNVRGITLVTWMNNGYSRSSAAEQLNAIQAAGITHLTLICTAYMTSKSASSVYTDFRTPTVGSLVFLLQEAKSRGLQTILKAHVNLDNGEWSATIEPADRQAWMDSYQNFLLLLANAAETADADMLIIGNELSTMLDMKEHWRNLISETRQLYSGQITYAATWDAAMLVPFWNELDYTGINFYAPVTQGTEVSRFELLTGWQHWLDWLEEFRSATKKPLLLTEIGYRSLDGAGMSPEDFTTRGPYDPSEQEDLYWAALESISNTDAVEGVIWWNWLADGNGGDGNLDYTPLGKPAYDVLKETWADN